MAKKEELLNGEKVNMKKWLNPKIKVRKVFEKPPPNGEFLNDYVNSNMYFTI